MHVHNHTQTCTTATRPTTGAPATNRSHSKPTDRTPQSDASRRRRRYRCCRQVAAEVHARVPKCTCTTTRKHAQPPRDPPQAPPTSRSHSKPTDRTPQSDASPRRRRYRCCRQVAAEVHARVPKCTCTTTHKHAQPPRDPPQAPPATLPTARKAEDRVGKTAP